MTFEEFSAKPYYQPINAQPFMMLLLIIDENRNYYKRKTTETSKT